MRMTSEASTGVQQLADADGHLIEPGDLWVERLPEDLRPLAPHFYRDPDGTFHSRIYGIEVGSLEVMHGGIRARDMLENMGLASAMGVPLERVFTGPAAERHTILDAPHWAMDGRARLDFNLTHGVSRAVLYPTFMLAGGTLLPNLAPAVCQVYNDWVFHDYCGASRGRLIPVATLPLTDVDAAIAEVRRTAEMGFPAVFIRTNPVHGRRYSDRAFEPLWQAIVDTNVKLGLHPLPMWDQDGASRGYRLPDIMAASCLGFPLDMIHTLYEMMAGGVFDRFPTMQTMILEAGVGWLPSFFERFEEHRERFGSLKAPEWKTPPMEIFLRQMMITVEACEEVDLKIALEFLPADHVALWAAAAEDQGTYGDVDGVTGPWLRPGFHGFLWSTLRNWCTVAGCLWPADLPESLWRLYGFLADSGRLHPDSDPLPELRKVLVCSGGLGLDGLPNPGRSPIPCECYRDYTGPRHGAAGPPPGDPPGPHDPPVASSPSSGSSPSSATRFSPTSVFPGPSAA